MRAIRQQVERAIRLFGVAHLVQRVCYTQGVALDKAKARLDQAVQKRYKELAFEHHPDRGGDPQKMVEVNTARDLLGRVRFEPPLPRQVVTVQVYQWATWASSSATSTSYSTGNYYGKSTAFDTW